MEKIQNNDLVNTGLISTIHRPDRSKRLNDPKVAAELEAKRVADRELVRGIFRYHETPNGEVGFVYRAYKGDPMETYVLKDGETYTIPVGVAKHLNAVGRCDYPTYNYQNNEAGLPVVSLFQRVRRMSFQNLDFTAPNTLKKSTKVDPYKSALPQ